MNISGLWYVTTAVHLWRFYFRYMNRDPERMMNADRENWKACDRAVRGFTDPEREILQVYYMSGFGNYDDMKAVTAVAEQRGISKSDVWDLIKRANYNVIVERGLMERRTVNV